MWWFAVIASTVFTIAEAGIQGAAVQGAVLLIGVWWSGIALVVIGVGRAAVRTGIPWSPAATATTIALAIAVGWLGLFTAGAVLEVPDVADSIWQASLGWVPTSVLTMLLVIAGSHYLRTAITDRERLQQQITKLNKRTNAIRSATQRVSDEVQRVKVRVAETLSSPSIMKPSDIEPIADDARYASHRVSGIETPKPSRRFAMTVDWLRIWLDDLAYAREWSLFSGFMMVLAIIAPRALLVEGSGGVHVIVSYLAAAGLAVLLAKAMKPYVNTASPNLRRALLPLCAGVPLIPATWLMFDARMSGIELIASTLATFPLATIGALAPTSLASDAERREQELRALQDELAVAEQRCAVALTDLELTRRQAISELHGSVQGKALAALAAAELRGAEHVSASALEELMSWAASQTRPLMHQDDALHHTIATWEGVLDITINAAKDLTDTECQTLAPFLQDALVNAVGHGRAHSVSIEITRTNAALLVRVTDDGIGPKVQSQGLGAQRVIGAGGSWTLTATEPHGAVQTITLPTDINS